MERPNAENRMEAVMTEEEVAALRAKIGKSHLSQKDWDLIHDVLEDRILFTANPVMIHMKRKYTTDGILTHGGALLAFTSEAACTHYLKRIGMQQTDKYMKITKISFDTLRNAASARRKMAYIDISEPSDGKIVGIDGRTGTVRVYHMKK